MTRAWIDGFVVGAIAATLWLRPDLLRAALRWYVARSQPRRRPPVRALTPAPVRPALTIVGGGETHASEPGMAPRRGLATPGPIPTATLQPRVTVMRSVPDVAGRDLLPFRPDGGAA